MDRIYDGSIHDITDFINDSDLFVNSCGIQQGIKVGRHTVIRELGRKDYHILFILRGKCTITIEGSEYEMGKNSFAVYYPHQKQKYIYEGDEYVYWLHFSGTKATRLLEKCGLEYGVYKCSDSVGISEIFKKMVTEYRVGDALSDIKLPALLAQLLCELSFGVNRADYVNPYVAQLAEFIYSDYHRTPDIDSFARMASLSRDRFVHLFSKQMGMPPHKFLINVRLKEALWMLKYTDMSVGEIAYRVGFSDALSFSRIFKKHYGTSPKNIRK